MGDAEREGGGGEKKKSFVIQIPSNEEVMESSSRSKTTSSSSSLFNPTPSFSQAFKFVKNSEFYSPPPPPPPNPQPSSSSQADTPRPVNSSDVTTSSSSSTPSSSANRNAILVSNRQVRHILACLTCGLCTLRTMLSEVHLLDNNDVDLRVSKSLLENAYTKGTLRSTLISIFTYLLLLFIGSSATILV